MLWNFALVSFWIIALLRRNFVYAGNVMRNKTTSGDFKMSLFRKNKKIEGEIGYFGLQEWWLSELTKEERNVILSVYSPLGIGEDSLIWNK